MGCDSVGIVIGGDVMMTVDEDLEAAIDRAGRESVFAYVERMGYQRGEPLPKWMWYYAAAEVLRRSEA